LALSQISPMPLRCPVSDCNEIVCSREVLHHILSNHSSCSISKEDIHLAFESERSILLLNVDKLKPTKTVCLGILLYGGKRNDPAGLPTDRGISHPSYFDKQFKQEQLLIKHLPVLILARRCSLHDWLKEKDLPFRHKTLAEAYTLEPVVARPARRHDIDVLLVWTLSSTCSKRLHVTMTAYDDTMSESRSAIRAVSNSGVRKYEIEGEQMPFSKHAMWLTWYEVENLIAGGDKKHINLELILHEDFP
ncbi:hypothetical protein KR018_007352, partial [Drosophila ironensis]